MTRRFFIALCTVLAGLVVFAPAASAHAELESTEPAAGAILTNSPNEIVLTFSEAVQVDDDGVKLINAKGERVGTGAIEQPEGRTIRLPVDGLPDGGYVVAWKVVSADGHPIGGGFTWRIGESSTAVDPTLIEDVLNGQSAPRAVGVLAGIMRFLDFGGLLLLVGGSVLIAALWPDGADRKRTRRVMWGAWGAVAVSTLLSMGLQGASVNGLGLLDAFKPSTINTTLDTTFGKAAIARLLLLVPAAVLLQLLPSARKLWWQVLAVATGVGLLLTPVLSGHADTGRWIAAARIADLLHLAAGSVWLGGLAMLAYVVLRSDVTEAKSITERFSPVAFGAVTVVVLSGTFQSVRQMATLDQLETPYGRLLIVKVVLVLGLIGVASLTRSALQGRLVGAFEPVPIGPGAAVEGEHDEVSILRRLVGAEVIVAVMVLAVTALLVDANPGNAAVVVAAGPFDETHVVDDTLINAVVVPGTLGPTDVHLYVDDPAGGLAPPVDA
jgi:copper transport protein